MTSEPRSATRYVLNRWSSLQELADYYTWDDGLLRLDLGDLNHPPWRRWLRLRGQNAGNLICDGSLLSVADNPALFAAIGTSYGGDGTAPDYERMDD